MHVFGDLRVDGLDWERLGTGLAAEGFEVFLADGGPLHITSMHHLTALASVDSIGGTEGVFDDLEDRNALLPDYELVRFAPAAPPLASFPNARCAHLRGAGHSGRPDITHWLLGFALAGSFALSFALSFAPLPLDVERLDRGRSGSADPTDRRAS